MVPLVYHVSLFTDLFSRHLRQGNKAQVEFTYVAGWACFGFNILHVMLSVHPTSTDSQRLRANRQKAMDQYSKHLSEPRDCSPPPIPFPRIAALINKSVDDIEELSVEEHRVSTPVAIELGGNCWTHLSSMGCHLFFPSTYKCLLTLLFLVSRTFTVRKRQTQKRGPSCPKEKRWKL